MTEQIKILYLSLNSDLKGPIPKIDPLLIAAWNDLGCHITKGTWGRHAEDETLLQKTFGRLEDIRHAISLLRAERYDVLYVATTLDEYALARDVALLFATRRLPVKKVLIEHGSKTTPLVQAHPSLYKLFTRVLIRLSDAILLLSNQELEHWSNFEPAGKYYRIDNPFCSNDDPTSDASLRMVPNQSDKPMLLFVGRLIKPKGILDVLDAMPLILKQTDCHLLVAGAGTEQEEIQRRINSTDLNGRVSLLGYLNSSQLSALYRSATVLILPTYCGEGFPTVVAEAMSYGLPIITTAIRGTYDHLQDGQNALFVPPRDPQSIAQAVLKLIDDPNLCVRMGQANRMKVQDFRPENVAPKYLQIFREVLKDRSG